MAGCLSNGEVSNEKLSTIFRENHFALESLYDADDTVVEIRALDNLLNGQISTQVQDRGPNIFFKLVNKDLQKKTPKKEFLPLLLK